jgi:hypothetical protein
MLTHVVCVAPGQEETHPLWGRLVETFKIPGRDQNVVYWLAECAKAIEIAVLAKAPRHRVPVVVEERDSVDVIKAWLLLFHGYDDGSSSTIRALRRIFGARNTVEEFKVKQANLGLIEFGVIKRPARTYSIVSFSTAPMDNVLKTEEMRREIDAYSAKLAELLAALPVPEGVRLTSVVHWHGPGAHVGGEVLHGTVIADPHYVVQAPAAWNTTTFNTLDEALNVSIQNQVYLASEKNALVMGEFYGSPTRCIERIGWETEESELALWPMDDMESKALY